MADVLCILSSDRVFVIDMDYILKDEDYKEGKGLPLKRLPVKRTLDFVKCEMPLGMGLGKWRNSLYMFGGYHHHSQSADVGPDLLYFGFNERVEEDLPRLAYMFDLTGGDESEPVPLSSMLGPKLYPIVEVIDNKIYVLSRLMWSRQLPSQLPSQLPMFEVFYPETGTWRTLPQPLPLSKIWRVEYHTVCGSVITCQLVGSYGWVGKCHCRFNTITEQWEYPEEITRRELICMYADRDVQNEDVYFTTGEEGFYAMTERGWNPRGKDIGYCTPFDPADIYPDLGDTFYGMSVMILSGTSDPKVGYNCGLVSYEVLVPSSPPAGQALNVIAFQVEKLLEPDEALSIRCLRHQVYEFKSEDGQPPYFDIKKAIIGRVSYNIHTGIVNVPGRKEEGKENEKRKKEEEH